MGDFMLLRFILFAAISVRAMVPQTGRFQDRPIKVEVHVPPEIIELDDKMEATEGNEAILRCQASGFPRPIYNWFDPEQRNLSKLEGYSVDTDTGILTINSVKRENRGRYTCLAKNPAGEAKRSLDLSVIGKPSGLTDSRIAKVTATTITFEFEGPNDDGGLPIRTFVVKYREENEPYDQAIVHEWNKGFPYVLENLKPRTAYRFRFAAKNEVGVGEWSEEMRIVMPTESFPEPPKFITPGGNVSTYPDRFQIRWTVPLNNGRKIDYFVLRYFEAEKKEGMWRQIGESIVKQVKDWENAPLYEMTNLKANTFYKVEVRAHNNIGFSQGATMVFQTAAGVEGSSEVICDESILTICPDMQKMSRILREEYGDNVFPTESFLDTHCSMIIDTAKCLRPYASCALEGSAKFTIDTLADLAIDKLVQLCDKDSSLRSAFNEHAQCINEHALDFYSCEAIRQVPYHFKYYLKSRDVYDENRLNAYECLGIALSLNCMGQQFVRSCGFESTDLFFELFSGIEEIFNSECPPEINGVGVSLFIEYMFNREEILDN